MKKYIKQIASTLALLTVMLAPALVTTSAFAATEIQNSVCKGASLELSGTADCSEESVQGAGGKLDSLITDVVNIFSVIVGVVAVIMIIYGGFRYITSGGDSGNVTNAKNTILYALVGLVIVALAQFIVKFVLAKVTSAGN